MVEKVDQKQEDRTKDLVVVVVELVVVELVVEELEVVVELAVEEVKEEEDHPTPIATLTLTVILL